MIYQTNPNGPTLGQTLRGARLGYRWVSTVGAYVRVSDEGESDLLVDVVPPGEMPSKGLVPTHRCWWENASMATEIGQAVLAVVAPSAARARIRRRLSVVLDTNGRFVRAWGA